MKPLFEYTHGNMLENVKVIFFEDGRIATTGANMSTVTKLQWYLKHGRVYLKSSIGADEYSQHYTEAYASYLCSLMVD